jgi:hypothetical protein
MKPGPRRTKRCKKNEYKKLSRGASSIASRNGYLFRLQVTEAILEAVKLLPGNFGHKPGESLYFLAQITFNSSSYVCNPRHSSAQDRQMFVRLHQTT